MLISKFSNEKVEFEIRVFEEKFQFEFPLQYKRFLLKIILEMMTKYGILLIIWSALLERIIMEIIY